MLTNIETRKLFAAGELLLAATIWGFGFVATIWALQSVDPISMSLIRFGIAFIAGMIGFLIWQKTQNNYEATHRAHLILSAGPGIFLSLTIGLQTWGLQFTTATNSGFITTLYVVIVPFLDAVLLKRRVPMIHLLWVAFAILGTALMIQLHLDTFNTGDALTLGCAFAAAIQITWIGRIHHQIQSPFLFNIYQSLWAAAGTIVLWPFYGGLYWHAPDNKALIGLFSLTIGSTLLAFALQVRAQKIVSPSLASILFLLESPFAAYFAFLLLYEKITTLQALGGVIIFLAAFGATKTERR
jgi:drug/metabolite transporter (DMT)-like permease